MKSFIVVSTILLLTCIMVFVFFQFMSHTDKKNTKAKYTIEYFCMALESYYMDHGRYPLTEDGLLTLVNTKNKKGEPYLVKLSSDPWGYPYRYASPGNNNTKTFDLWTYGADNRKGGKDHNKDIVNW